MARTLWFKAKRYGYGWYPVTWQGWLVTIGWVLWLVSAIDRWNVAEAEPTPMTIAFFLAEVTASVVVLITIAALTGEKARWRWGGE